MRTHFFATTFRYSSRKTPTLTAKRQSKQAVTTGIMVVAIEYENNTNEKKNDNDDGWSSVTRSPKLQWTPVVPPSSSSSSSHTTSTTTMKKDYDVVIAPKNITNDATRRDADQRCFMVVLCGLPGSGKSTFARSLEASHPNKFVRINQDELKSRQKCERKVRQILRRTTTSPSSVSASSSSTQLRCPIIDRCNFDAHQRSTWYRLAEEGGAVDTSTNDNHPTIPVDVVVFDIPYDECLRRCQNRKGHETIKSPHQAAGVLQQLRTQWRPPPIPASSSSFHTTTSQTYSGRRKTTDAEGRRYRSLTTIRTEQQKKECLIRLLNQQH